MRIGNRVFPYPTLNTNGVLNEYIGDSSYRMEFDCKPDGTFERQGENIILKNARFVLTDKELMDLYTQGVVKSTLIVESSASIYRKKYELTPEGKDITIPTKDLKSFVFISSYLYAAADIPNFHNDNFSEDYQGRNIPIEKYSILAVDDGIRFKADIDYTEDNKVASIFLLIKSEDAGDIVKCHDDGNKIIIYLSEKTYQNYSNLKVSTKHYNIFFATLIIPFLTNCIANIQKETKESLDDIYESSQWMRSVAHSYEKATGKELKIDTFNDTPAVELAQIVMNQATARGVNDYCELILNGNGGNEDDSD